MRGRTEDNLGAQNFASTTQRRASSKADDFRQLPEDEIDLSPGDGLT